MAKIKRVTLAASAERTTGASGTGTSALALCRRVQVLLDITASASQAGDTLDVYVDVLAPDGATWVNAVHFTQQAGNGAARKEIATLDPANPGTSVVNVTSDANAAAVRPALWGSQMRARWAIANGGGTHAFTFAVTALGDLG